MKRMWLRTTVRMLVGVVLGLLMAAVWMGSHPGQADAQTITMGSTARGAISGNGATVSYYFDGQAGSVVTIRMTKVSGSLDPYLELYSPQGSMVRSDDDSGGNYNSLIANYTLPSTGRYRIAARGYGGTGSFDLSLSGGSGGGSGCGGAIQSGQTVNARISSAGQQCKFTFSGASNAAVNIVMEKVNSGLDPYIELYDPSGRKVAADDDSAGNYNSAISNYVLRSSGVYTIVAKSYGNQTGDFRLKFWVR
jgi:hypothetical protein